MKAQIGLLSTAAIVAMMAGASPAAALSMKECGAKYQAAKKDGSLKDQKWADFRKAQCGDDDAPDSEAKAVDPDAEPAAKPAASAASAAKPAANAMAPKTGDAKAGAAAAGAGVSTTTAAAGSAKVAFPTEISAKYASESPGRARMHTCVDQYRANKAAGATGMRWIEKGGGYYSQCNAKLKG